MKVFIVGIADHAYQCDRNGNSAATCFGNYLVDLCKTQKFVLVAEEFSEMELRERKLSESVPQRVARDQRIEHLFVDPDRDERRGLEIPDDDEICSRHNIRRGDFDDFGDAEIASKRPLYWGPREDEWLRRILACGKFPCLLIIGAAHLNSVSEKLKVEGIEFSVLCNRWQSQSGSA